MKKEGNTDFVFPVGKGTKWERIGISNLITTSTYTAEYFNSDGITDGNYTSNAINADLTGISAAGYWMLGKTNAEDACGITLHWENASENNINDASLIELRVAHWNSGNSIWEAFDINTGLSTGSTSATSSGSITTNNTHSDFSPFKIGKKVIPTPIELLNFNGACYDKKIVLNWSTASETNNDYFFVERSEDELEFSSIGIISGAGNSNNILTYHFVDESPFSGISYYRLKQTDYDGAYSYSGVVAVNCEKELVSEFSAYGLNF
ncbi:MAG: hypothetical protein HY738_11690 [Bacteroidia bacterium]|nr:hypothetical protein [Bacteroidia bacterium]